MVKRVLERAGVRFQLWRAKIRHSRLELQFIDYVSAERLAPRRLDHEYELADQKVDELERRLYKLKKR